MNKSVIPKDYLVDKYDNALLAKNKKKRYLLLVQIVHGRFPGYDKSTRPV